MFNIKKSSIILLISIALLQVYLSSAIGSEQLYQCDHWPGDGPNAICTKEYNPVCAYHHGDNQGTTVGNPCGACHQELYDYYTLGACKGDDDNQNNPPGDWDDSFLEYCEEGDDDNNPDDHPGDWDDSFLEYCEEDESDKDPEPIVCDAAGADPTTVLCPAIYQPICGYFYNDTYREHGKTISNACMACYYQKYDYYIPGECPEDEPLPVPDPVPLPEPEPESVRCDISGANPAAVLCPAVYEPVCGYSDKDLNRENGKTSSNKCQACYYEKFDYYTPGECPGDEPLPVPEPIPLPVPEPESKPVRCEKTGANPAAVTCPAIYTPVCGYFDHDTNREHGENSSNDCLACHYKQFDYYIPGKCPKVEPEIHVCDRSGTVFGAVMCPALYKPVCGYLYTDTKRANGKTASNDCTGCHYSLFDYYIDGACPGDNDHI